MGRKENLRGKFAEVLFVNVEELLVGALDVARF